METIVRIPPPLRTLTAGKDEVPAVGATVRDVIEDLEKRHPGIRERLLDEKGVRRFINIYVGEEDVRFLDGLKTELKSGDQMWTPSIDTPGTHSVLLTAHNDAGSGSASTVLTLDKASTCPEMQLCALGGRFQLRLAARDHRSGRTAAGRPLPENDPAIRRHSRWQ